jgi:hypothetical protein
VVPEGCHECGFDSGEDRTSLAARSDAFPEIVNDILRSADANLIRRRPAPEVWSPVEYAAHVGEAVRWYVGRIRCVLEEDLPQLESFDFDAAAEAGEYYRRRIDAVVADLRTSCRELADIARSVSASQLSRYGLGSDGSPRSVASLLTRADHELVHHEFDLRRSLVRAGKQ